MSGLDMVREIIGQINNLRKLVTVNGKQYKYDPKSKSYKAGGRTFTPSQLKAQLEGQSYKAPSLKIKKTPSKGGPVKDVVSAVANIGVDRGMHALYNKFSGKKTTFKSWQAMQNALKDPRGSWVVKKSQVNKPDNKDNKRTTFKGAKRINRRPTGAERNKDLRIKKNTVTKETPTHGQTKVQKTGRQGQNKKTLYWNSKTNKWQSNIPAPIVTDSARRKSKGLEKNKTTGKDVDKKVYDNINQKRAKDKLDKKLPTRTDKGYQQKQPQIGVQTRSMIEKEKQEWGPKGQPKASTVLKIQKQNDASSQEKERFEWGPGGQPKAKRIYKNDLRAKKDSNKSNKSKKKSGSKYPARIGGKKISSIQKKLIDGGWTKDRLEEKMRQHKNWKAARGRR